MGKYLEQIGLLGLVILFLVAAPFRSAFAVEFTVNDTSDAADSNPGDSACSISIGASGNCTLRAAIQETNALPGADIINLPPGTYTLSIAGTGEDAAATSDLDIRDDLTIQSTGPSAAATTVVDGGGVDRVFDIDGFASSGGNAEVHFQDFTVQNGIIATEDAGGAGVRSSFARLFLTGMIVTDNHVNSSFSSSTGGGLDNEASVSAEIVRTTFRGNSAERGGAVFSNSPLSISHSTIDHNHARTAAGGISSYNKLDLTNTTISSNTADNNTGAIYSTYDPPTLLDTPLFRECTIVNNSAPTTGGISLGGNSELSLLNTIIANNSNGNCYFGNVAATLVNEDYNISSDTSCNLGGANDMENTDPRLGPLANNGGRTKTHLPTKDSPAIDAGFNLFTSGLETDQRGVTRPQNGRVDIGSVELESECSFFVIPAKNGKTTAFCL